MKYFLAIAALLLCAACISPARAQETKPAANAQPEPPELAEATRLGTEVVRLYNEAKYADALPPARRALEIREKALGPEHRLTVSALNNLAALNRELGRTDEAEKLWLRVLPFIERAPNDYGNLVEGIYNQLAVIRFKKGDKAGAEGYLQRGLSLQEKLAGPAHPSLLPFLYNSFEFYMTRKDYERAAPFLERALDIQLKLPPRADAATARRLRSYYCPMLGLKSRDLAGKISRALTRVERPEQALEDDRRWAELNDRETAGARAEGGVLNGKAVSKPQPVYPPEAKSQRVSGTVAVYITVDEQGKVIAAEAVCGHHLLAGPSVAAARQARFTPTLLSGKPVKVSGVITYNFVLQ